MKRHRNEVGYQDKGNASWPVGEGTPEDAVPKEEPVAGNTQELGGADPSDTLCAGGGGEVVDRKDVKVESSKAHDGVVGVALVLDSIVGDFVPDKGEVIVCGVD